MIPSSSNNTKILSVLEAKQVNAGKISVIGMIISGSVMYKSISKSEWECQNIRCASHGSAKFDPPRSIPLKRLDNTDGTQLKCDECQSNAYDVENEYYDTLRIQIADTDKADNYNSLDVILYDDAARNIVAGEIVTITGDIHIQTTCGASTSTKKLVNVLYSSSVFYRNREELKFSTKDIETIHNHKKLVEKSNSLTYVDTLVSMFAPNVIGHNDKKLGLLRSLVGGSLDYGDENGRRERIHIMLVGDPG